MQTKQTDDRRTVSVEQAARELGIGRGLAYECARRGEIPVLRVGRRFLVPRAALDRLLAGDSLDRSAGPAPTPAPDAA